MNLEDTQSEISQSRKDKHRMTPLIGVRGLFSSIEMESGMVVAPGWERGVCALMGTEFRF